MPRPISRQIRQAATVVGVVVGLAVSLVPTLHDRQSTVSVLQMNLCNSGWAGCFTGQSVSEAAAVIRDRQPDVVSLNEICRRDVDTLARAFDTDRVVALFQPVLDRRAGGPIRCRDDEPYGIGLVVRTTARADGVRMRGGTYPIQDPGAREERAWMCAPSPGGFTACTTHLANANPLIATARCHYLFTDVVTQLTGPVVVSGDFNLATLSTCLPAGFHADSDGALQYVVVAGPADRATTRLVAMRNTDHPALLVSRPAVGFGTGATG